MKKREIYSNYLINNYSGVKIGSISDYKDYEKKILDSVGDILKKRDKKESVLELGCGSGRMAFMFRNLRFRDFTGVDLSESELKISRSNFENFTFHNDDIKNFLKKTKRKYDIVLMYHVFEHLTRDEGTEVLELIKKVLSDKGIFINVMPNASAYFNSSSMFFADITHERIYNENSFRQILISTGYNKIVFRNLKVGRNFFFRIIHKIFIKIFESFLTMLGYSRYRIYTSSMITVAGK